MVVPADVMCVVMMVVGQQGSYKQSPQKISCLMARVAFVLGVMAVTVMVFRFVVMSVMVPLLVVMAVLVMARCRIGGSGADKRQR